MARVFLTGASGFLGGRLVRHLVSRGDQVRCLVRPTSDVSELRRLGVEVVFGDLARPDDLGPTVRGCDIVYHLAARTASPRPRDMYHVNAGGTARVLRACAAQPTPPVTVVVSSLAAAGASRRGRPRSTADVPSPISHYGRSKRAAERVAEAWAARLPISVVRPTVVFGQGDREMLAVFQSIRRYRVHLVPTYSPPRLTLLHQADLIRTLVAVAERGRRLPGPARVADRPGQGYYFAADPQILSYEQMGRMIADAMHAPCPLMLYVSEPLLWGIAAANQWIGELRGESQQLNPDKVREVTVPMWAASTRETEHDLRVRPARPLAARFRETAQWYLEQGWL
jgi:nucleoside-diphosphate-sugar epimerase